ncbi:MAG TPA: M14 family metallopeptidase [Gemmatimonadaceae bacterium]|nr:M14 family metallopeptidase [Gemmatimonadaceae bacterium]
MSRAPSEVRNQPQNSISPRTRAERTDYRETSTYADVLLFIDSLRGRSELAFGTIGKTTQGREIPYVIASRPRVSTPAEARALGRPIVYVQGNIHAGEVEGKEALLAMLRDLTSPGRTEYLDKLILIAVPIYNADGNEKFAPQEVNRTEQNGPEMVGERPNAQGLDLNRDYIKAEAPETRASLAMFQAWDPDVFVDLHTTDGSFHGYALTYSGSLNPAAPLGVFTRDVILPTLRSRMRSRGFETFDYGNFVSEDTVSKGWETFDARPRFGTNYYGLRGGISILSEAYSHDPFKRRVESTYAFVDEILKLVSERGTSIRSTTSLSIASVPIRSRVIAAPTPVDVIVERMDRTGDSSRTQPGVPKGVRRSGKFETIRMPVFDRFEPTLFAARPPAYAIAASEHEAVAVLRTHGIIVTPLAVTSTARADRFVVDSAIVAPRLFQKHHEVQLTGRWVTEQRELRAGTYIVRTTQPLGLLAVYLLEPQTDDGIVTWNLFDEAMVFGSSYPVLRVMSEPHPVAQ